MSEASRAGRPRSYAAPTLTSPLLAPPPPPHAPAALDRSPAHLHPERRGCLRWMTGDGGGSSLHVRLRSSLNARLLICLRRRHLLSRPVPPSLSSPGCVGWPGRARRRAHASPPQPATRASDPPCVPAGHATGPPLARAASLAAARPVRMHARRSGNLRARERGRVSSRACMRRTGGRRSAACDRPSRRPPAAAALRRVGAGDAPRGGREVGASSTLLRTPPGSEIPRAGAAIVIDHLARSASCAPVEPPPPLLPPLRPNRHPSCPRRRHAASASSSSISPPP